MTNIKHKLTRARFLKFLEMKGFTVTGEMPYSGRPFFDTEDRKTTVITPREKEITIICNVTNSTTRHTSYEAARDAICKLRPVWQMGEK
ncbi:MAG: hypothetical protein GTN64_05545 [Candidatus Latescibacteria bacterium]|nr:hypothetical protein [Candidatus Latescibacterota bacterium]NIO78073.1 hypothetical protein [Candidatus Latescibacterota bacterium]